MARAAAKPKSRTSSSAAQLHKRHSRHSPAAHGDLPVLPRLRERQAKCTAGARNPPKSNLRTRPRTNKAEDPQRRPGQNQDATLLGLPTELRLEIYAYLSDATLIHVHSPRAHKYTWTPCKASNPDHPLLCLNPKWSGLCSEDQRCTFKHAAPPEPRGFWGLAATSKLVRQEMQEYFMKESVFSIHPLKVRGWLQWLKNHAPKKLNLITKITLAGPDQELHFPDYVLPEIKEKLPNIIALGYQCQMTRWVSGVRIPPERLSLEIETTIMWRRWRFAEWLKIFAPTVTIVIEGLVWIKKQKVKYDESETTFVRISERQGIARAIQDGKEDGYKGTGWEWDDVKFEMVQPKALVAKKMEAEWRIWWEAEELEYFGV